MRSIITLRGPPAGPRLLGCGPSGLLDNVLHALRALRSCDPRNSAMMGRFDTSGSMIPLSVSEISALDGFCDGEELGVLVVGLFE